MCKIVLTLFATVAMAAALPSYGHYAGPQADALPAGSLGFDQHYNGAITPKLTPSVAQATNEALVALGAQRHASGYGGNAILVASGPAIIASGYAHGYSGPLADSYPAGAHGFDQHYNGAITPKLTPSVAQATNEHLAVLGAQSHGLAYGGPAIHAYAPSYGVHGAIAYSGPQADSYPAGSHGFDQHYNGAITPKLTPSVAQATHEHLAVLGAQSQYH